MQVFVKIANKKIFMLLLLAIDIIASLKFVFSAVLDYQDRHYAANYFSFMPYERVLESRRWLEGGLGTLGCTYAVVSLSDSAPTNPPSEWVDSALWHATPVLFKDTEQSGQCRNIICKCKQDWTATNYQLLNKALNEPGSYYSLGGGQPPHDTLYQAQVLVYSPVEKVSAAVRFGD